LAAATSAAPRRFLSSLRLDVTSPSALFNQSIKGPHKATHGPRRSHIPAPPHGGQTLPHKVMQKNRATAAATSSRGDKLTSHLPVISACRASSCHSASSRWRPASPRWVSLSRKRRTRTSSVDRQCHWRLLGRPCEKAGAPERPWASPSPRRARCCFSPPAPALPGPFAAAPAALPPTPVPRGRGHLALCDKTRCVTGPSDSLASSDSESAGGAPVTEPVCLH